MLTGKIVGERGRKATATLLCGRTVAQVRARIAELELSAREAPRFPGGGYATLPDDTAENAKEWAESEGKKAKIMEGIVNFNRDPRAALGAMR